MYRKTMLSPRSLAVQQASALLGAYVSVRVHDQTGQLWVYGAEARGPQAMPSRMPLFCSLRHEHLQESIALR